MTTTPTIIIQGITLAQYTDLLEDVVRKVLAENQLASAQSTEADALPEEVPAKQAAVYCNYKTGKSLAQYHHNGLTPMRVNGTRLFYKKAEVIALKKRLQR